MCNIDDLLNLNLFRLACMHLWALTGILTQSCKLSNTFNMVCFLLANGVAFFRLVKIFRAFDKVLLKFISTLKCIVGADFELINTILPFDL